MDSKTQSKPTYRIEETRELLPKLVDQVVQSNSFNEKNIKEEIEELISSDPSFVRSISNAISNIPSAGGNSLRVNQEPDGVAKPADIPFEEVKGAEGRHPASGNEINVDNNTSESSGSSDDSSSISTIGESIKSEIYALAQSIMSELRSLGGSSSGSSGSAGAAGDDIPLTGSPEEVRQLANEMGKGKGPEGGNIRFERMDNGNYQQYIDGSKGEVFTESELRGAIDQRSGGVGSVDGGSYGATSQSFLDKINEEGKGKAPNGGDIRFERMADGTYQQYIDGSQGEIFTKEELKEAIGNKEKENEENNSEDVSNNSEEDRAEDGSKTSKTSDDSFPVPLDVTGETCISGVETFEIWDKIKQNQGNSNGLTLQCTVSNFSITDIQFIDEYEPDSSMKDLVETDGSGEDRVQKSFKLPLAKKDTSSGGWLPLARGGYYTTPVFCVNGTPCIFPLKHF